MRPWRHGGAAGVAGEDHLAVLAVLAVLAAQRRASGPVRFAIEVGAAAMRPWRHGGSAGVAVWRR